MRSDSSEKNIRVVALYLPQFYVVPENEAWWGKNFTDWVSTQNAKKLFDHHYQPHVPLNKNYYDLLEKKTMELQAELLEKYNVDGLCFYHYWFGNGRKMLEKPAENLLNWKDVNIPFCFCWANMSWARSWANIKNADFWINEERNKYTKDGKALLIEQLYGDKNEWRRHFEYLLPFFKDSRYIKIDNKPIIWIYRTDLIEGLDQMKKMFNELAIENGLKGVYFIGSYYTPQKKDGLDAAVIYEPGEILPKVPFRTVENTSISIYDYDEYWETSIKQDYKDIKTFYTGLVNYDSTPRQGNNGDVISGTPELFKKWLKSLLKKSSLRNNEIVFLNAWNEWGEGNHIEPDERYKYQYLEAISDAKNSFNDVEIEEREIEPISDKTLIEVTSYKNQIDKVQRNLTLVETWLKKRQEGVPLIDCSLLENVNRIAVYGCGVLGRLLVSEFRDTHITIDYFLDRTKSGFYEGIPVLHIDDSLPDVDCIVIALPNYYDEIIEDLNRKCKFKYVLIDELVRG